MTDFDVIISGGGPAGAIAGFFLAEAGVKTLLLEKQKLPRHKTCGGGLTGKSLSHIPFDISSVLENVCTKLLIRDHSVDINVNLNSDSSYISMVKREKFDSFILEKGIEKGLTVKDEIELKSFSQDKNIKVITEKEVYSAEFLIAADGSLSRIVKECFKKDPRQLIPAIDLEVDSASLTEQKNSSARFDFGIIDSGYAWTFPKKDYYSIGILSTKKMGNHLKEKLDTYLKILGISKEEIISERGFVIPVKPLENFYSGRILFTGDAAGLADPITAEGIGFALLSGKIAAESLIRSELDPIIAGQKFNKQMKNEISSELRYSRILASLIYRNPSLRKFIIRKYGNSLARILSDIFAGKTTYKNVLSDLQNYKKLVYKKLN